MPTDNKTIEAPVPSGLGYIDEIIGEYTPETPKLRIALRSGKFFEFRGYDIENEEFVEIEKGAVLFAKAIASGNIHPNYAGQVSQNVSNAVVAYTMAKLSTQGIPEMDFLKLAKASPMLFANLKMAFSAWLDGEKKRDEYEQKDEVKNESSAT
jgi:hypothetical protein